MNRSSAESNPLSPSINGKDQDPVRGSVIGRTHRVVRERARDLQVRRSRNRSLLLPVLVASSLIIILVSAFWVILDEYEIAPVGDSRFQLPILLIWFLPVTGALLIVALLRRFRTRAGEETR